MNYIGEVPPIEFFDGLNSDSYNSYKNSYKNTWDLKSETLDYNLLDCKLLHKIMYSFGVMIFKNYKINIDDVVSTPSLAFKIYTLIPQGEGELYLCLKI